jgi:hypothetical protein
MLWPYSVLDPEMLDVDEDIVHCAPGLSSTVT